MSNGKDMLWVPLNVALVILFLPVMFIVGLIGGLRRIIKGP